MPDLAISLPNLSDPEGFAPGESISCMLEPRGASFDEADADRTLLGAKGDTDFDALILPPPTPPPLACSLSFLLCFCANDDE